MKTLSLPVRIALLMTALVGVSVFVTTMMIVSRYNEQLIADELDALEQETLIQSAELINRVREIRRDVQIIAGTSALRGLLRAADNGGIDPLGNPGTDEAGTPQDVWEARLATTFREFLDHKTNYVQMRLIGVADNGREIIRLGRAGDTGAIRITPDDALQNKGERPYFTEAIALPPGSVYVSNVTLNRENGVIQQPQIPVIRAAVPVATLSGQLFGIVVINYDVRDAFAAVARVADQQHTYMISDEQGNVLYHPDQRRPFAFEFGPATPLTQDFPALAALVGTDSPQRSGVVSPDTATLSVARRINIGSREQPRALTIVVSTSKRSATRLSDTVISTVGLLSVLLGLIAIMSGLLLTRVITQPLSELTQAVRHMGGDASTFDMPDDLPAEAGELAKAIGTAVAKLQQRSDELAATNRELQQFAYIASHDLQEPVRTISSYVSLIESHYGDTLDARGKQSMAFIIESCDRMRDLIHGLLEYSRLGAGSDMALTDIGALIEDVQADMAATIQARSAVVVVEPMPTLGVYPVELRLLFQNLISNAIKFVPAERTPLVQISAQKIRNHWQFRVADNGIGILPEHRERVFLIFQRLHGRGKYGGTGIGLAHCRKVVDLHHGRIWIEDNPDAGATICFDIHEVTSDAPKAETRLTG